MQILALDASTEWCSVALGGEHGFEERSEAAGQRHSELLLPMIESLLSNAKTSLSFLDGIAFGVGPGSFTGLRIACGVAQGLALGTGLRLIGIGTLDAIAEAARRRHGANRVIAAIDARMREVYVAAYEYQGERWQERIAPMVVSPEAVPLPPGAGWLAAGSGFSAYPALRLHVAAAISGIDADVVPSAAAIGALALPRFAAGEGVPARDAAPLYVRHRVAVTVAERVAGAVL
jgi:tRNA threonylcarbamoyladenosine biosynthesis protein TsaB